MKKRVSVIGSKSKLRQEKMQRTEVSRVSEGKRKKENKKYLR